MLKTPILLILCVSVFLVPAAEARVYLDIDSPAFVQIPIVLPKWKSLEKTPPALGAKIYEIVSNDLSLSGFFKVIDDQNLPPPLHEREGIPRTLFLQEWGPSGGELLLAGEVQLDPGGAYLKLRFHLFDLVEQKHLAGKQYEGALQALRGMVHRMSDEVVYQITGERGVHTTRLAYAVAQDEGKELFIADFDGANAKQITRNRSINLSPAWSPDNKKIAFTSYLRRNPDLYLVDRDGENFRLFSSHAGLNAAPSWSPDGKSIALMMGMEGKSDIYLLDADGNGPRRLTRGHGNEASPTWSPDGKRIAFVSDRSGTPQIYIMSASGSDVRRLTYDGNYNTNPSWSPKGKRIAFCGRAGGRFEIFTIDLDGSGLQRLTSGSGDNESPCWSPDGRYIAFSSNRAGVSKIFTMNANGFNQRPLTRSKGSESSPSWSRRFE